MGTEASPPQKIFLVLFSHLTLSRPGGDVVPDVHDGVLLIDANENDALACYETEGTAARSVPSGFLRRRGQLQFSSIGHLFFLPNHPHACHTCTRHAKLVLQLCKYVSKHLPLWGAHHKILFCERNKESLMSTVNAASRSQAPSPSG